MSIVLQNAELTINQRIEAANAVINDFTTSNVYLTIGGESPYPANDSLVTVPNQSTDYINSVYRNMIALKKVTAADMAFVVPRVDWQTGVVWDIWDNQEDLYSYLNLSQLTGTVNVANSRTVTGNGTHFLSQVTPGTLFFLPGDGENVASQTLQVTDVFSNTSLNVNTAFSGNFINNTAFSVQDTYPSYAENFYVRNTYDQVFICLNNNNGAISNTMPMLTIGGDLPEDAFIVTVDGYYWKYLYTIPQGQKQLFFSPDWMPVYKDPTTVQSAVGGRIDVILIQNGGTGYNQNVASNTASILTVVGDGTGANFTAQVSNTGTITGINVLHGGQNYTVANVVVAAGTTGAGANLRAIIGPQGGHGFDPVHELGATTLMISVQLSGTEDGTIPTGADVGTSQFEYRQIGLLQNPIVTSGNTASNVNYSAVSTITVQALPAGQFFNIDETVYQGVSLAQATFTAVVVFWDNINNVIWVNNITGSFTPQAPIVGTIETTPVTAFIFASPRIVLFTGKYLYIDNVLPIVRGVNQEEQIRLVLEF